MANPGEILVTYRELRDHGIPYCRLHLNRMVDRNQFPAPIWLSPNRKVWRLSQLQEFLATRTTSRADVILPGRPAPGRPKVVGDAAD